jgi:DNA-binding MarR family transcriptional regulator
LTIDRLARGGYVVRRRDPSDGRRVSLLLTKAGARIKSEKSVLDPERVAAMLAQLTPTERRAAIQGLALLARASSQAMQKNQNKAIRPTRSSA